MSSIFVPNYNLRIDNFWILIQTFRYTHRDTDPIFPPFFFPLNVNKQFKACVLLSSYVILSARSHFCFHDDIIFWLIKLNAHLRVQTNLLKKNETIHNLCVCEHRIQCYICYRCVWKMILDKTDRTALKLLCIWEWRQKELFFASIW